MRNSCKIRIIAASHDNPCEEGSEVFSWLVI